MAGDFAGLEKRRFRAASLFGEGRSQAQVARELAMLCADESRLIAERTALVNRLQATLAVADFAGEPASLPRTDWATRLLRIGGSAAPSRAGHPGGGRAGNQRSVSTSSGKMEAAS